MVKRVHAVLSSPLMSQSATPHPPWGGQVSAPERVIYLARRHPDLDRDAFVRRWRRHWAYVGGMAESGAVRRYAQCEVLRDTHPEPRDAVGISEFFSPEQRARIRTATEFRRLAQADERETFAAPVGDRLLIATFHVLSGSGTGPYKVMRFLRRRTGLDQAEFFRRWRGDYAAELLAAAPADLLGYAQNHAITPDLTTEWSLPADGAEEYFFDDLASAESFLDGALPRELAARHPIFDEPVDVVITNEVILKDVR